VPELERLRADHAEAVLAFESAIRAFFATSVSDRGEYFETFPERHRALLAEQDAGSGASYVLVDEDTAVLGRFNLASSRHGVSTLRAVTSQRERGVAAGVAQRRLRRGGAGRRIRHRRQPGSRFESGTR
jgi:ribosomal-protein-alanine N-acetyltransferase